MTRHTTTLQQAWMQPSSLALMLAAALSVAACGGGETDATESAQVTADKQLASPVGEQTLQTEAVGAYYIDSISGSDTQAGTQIAPWKTLARLNSAGLTMNQAIYLNCGAVWRESLSLTSAQLADGVRFAGYGRSCATQKPRILGSDSFAGNWTKSGNIWSRKVPAGTPKIARLFLDGAAQRLAQWPNADAGTPYASADPAAVASKLKLKLNAADALTLKTRDLVGAVVQARSVAWSMDTSKVTQADMTTNVLTTATETRYAMGPATEYVLTDKLWMLDVPGEYFHDTVNNMLYLYPATAAAQTNLNASAVEGSVRDVAVKLSGRSNLSVSGLSIEMARVDGFVLEQAVGAKVSDIVSRGHGRNGVTLTAGVLSGTARSVDFRNSVVTDNGVNGLYAETASRVDVVNNTISDTATKAMAGSSMAAVWVGPESSVQSNTVANSAYGGIRFADEGGSRIANNRVSGYCSRLTDCAAIYTWDQRHLPTAPASYGATVADNVIQDTAARVASKVHDATMVVGIYLDDFTSGVLVQNNTVHGGPIGIYVHDGSYNNIVGNRLWFNTYAASYFNMDQTDADYMTGNKFHGNEVVMASTVQGTYPAVPTFNSGFAFYFNHRLSGAASLSSGRNVFAENRVLILNAGDARVGWVTSATSDQKLGTADWRALNSGETQLTAGRQPIVSYAASLGAELVPNGDLSSGLTGWSSTFAAPATGAVSLVSNATAGCTGNCLQYKGPSASDTLTTPVVNLVAGKLYRLALHTVYQGQGLLAAPTSGFSAPGLVSSSSLSGLPGDVSHFTGVFKAAVTGPARIRLATLTPGVPVAFDNLSVREIPAYSLVPRASYAAVMAAGTADLPVSCATLGWPAGCTAVDTRNAAITLPALVKAGTATLFLRTGTALNQ